MKSHKDINKDTDVPSDLKKGEMEIEPIVLSVHEDDWLMSIRKEAYPVLAALIVLSGILFVALTLYVVFGGENKILTEILSPLFVAIITALLTHYANTNYRAKVKSDIKSVRDMEKEFFGKVDKIIEIHIRKAG